MVGSKSRSAIFPPPAVYSEQRHVGRTVLCHHQKIPCVRRTLRNSGSLRSLAPVASVGRWSAPLGVLLCATGAVGFLASAGGPPFASGVKLVIVPTLVGFPAL